MSELRIAGIVLVALLPAVLAAALMPVLKRATEQIGELAKQLEPIRRTDT